MLFHHVQNSRDWEVMTDIQSGVVHPEKNSIPGICEGFLMKKRKYPLQGWHKVREITEENKCLLCLVFTEETSDWWCSDVR